MVVVLFWILFRVFCVIHISGGVKKALNKQLRGVFFVRVFLSSCAGGGGGGGGVPGLLFFVIRWWRQKKALKIRAFDATIFIRV